MINLTPDQIVLISARERIQIPEPDISNLIGGWLATQSELRKGNVNIQANKERILFGEATAPLTGVGIFLGKDGSDYEFRIGDPSGNYFHYDGTNLTLVGGIITGGIIQTAASGKRIVMASNVLSGYDTNGKLRIRIDNDDLIFYKEDETQMGVLGAIGDAIYLQSAVTGNLYLGGGGSDPFGVIILGGGNPIAFFSDAGLSMQSNYPIYANDIIAKSFLPRKWHLDFDGWGTEDGIGHWRGWLQFGNQASANDIFGTYPMETGITTDDYVLTYTLNTGDHKVKWNQNPLFQVTIQAGLTTSQIIYLQMGSNTNGFGFKIVNGTLYAFTIVGSSEYTQEITGITLTNFNSYKAVYDYGTNIKFYVNNVLKYTQASNLPTTNSETIFKFSIQTKTGAARKMFVRNLRIVADIN